MPAPHEVVEYRQRFEVTYGEEFAQINKDGGFMHRGMAWGGCMFPSLPILNVYYRTTVGGPGSRRQQSICRL